jgi:hypothetical protein
MCVVVVQVIRQEPWAFDALLNAELLLQSLELALLLLPLGTILSFGTLVRLRQQLFDGNDRNRLGRGDDIVVTSLAVETSPTLRRVTYRAGAGFLWSAASLG